MTRINRFEDSFMPEYALPVETLHNYTLANFYLNVNNMHYVCSYVVTKEFTYLSVSVSSNSINHDQYLWFRPEHSLITPYQVLGSRSRNPHSIYPLLKLFPPLV